MTEVPFEQIRDRERGPRRHERGALAPHVAARLDRLDHRRVRGRPADAAFLELLHETRLGVARGRLRLVRRPARARCSATRCRLRRPRAAALRTRLRRPRRRLRRTRAASRGSRTSCPTRGTSPARPRSTSRRDGSSSCGRARRPSGTRPCGSRSARRGAARRRRARRAPRRACGCDHRPGGSLRAPPARSSPCCGTHAARRAGTPRRTARGSRCAPR